MSSDSSNKDLEYGDYLGVSTCHHIPNVEEKYLLYTPGSVLAIQVPSNDLSSWTRVRISAGASLTLSVATASFDREVPHNDCLESYGDDKNTKKEKTAELRYSCEGTDYDDITIVRFVPGQPTITGLGLVWEGSQVITFRAISPWGSVTLCGNVGHQTPQPQPQDEPYEQDEEVLIPALQPQESNDNSIVTTASTTTSKIRKRKPDAQALIDELAEMQREENPIKEQILPNTLKRTKVDDKASITVSTTVSTTTTPDLLEERRNLNDSQEPITTQHASADHSPDVSHEQKQDDTPQILSRRQRKKLAKEKAKELEQALALTRRSTTTSTVLTNGGSATSKSTTQRPTSLIKERRLKSGILVKDICLGDGPLVQPGRKVSIHYTGAFQDGTVFDASSTSANKPLQFRHGTGQVVRGLEEGMVGMRVGGERVLVIPPHLGYGEKGSGNRIPPNATLVFTVSLLSVGG